MKGKKRKGTEWIGMLCAAALMLTSMPTVAMGAETAAAISVELNGLIMELGEQGKNEKHYYEENFTENWGYTPENPYIDRIDYVEENATLSVAKSADFSGRVECFLWIYRLNEESIAEFSGQLAAFPVTEVGRTIAFTSEKYGGSAYASNRKDCIYGATLHAIPDDGSDEQVWEIKIRIGEKPIVTASAENGVQAQPASARILVNGNETGLEAYLIAGSNYFKLRDLAMAVSGTDKQFAVGYDAENKAIQLTSGQPYTVVGGELSSNGSAEVAVATASNSKLFVNGEEKALTAYHIGGNQYFKLRDIAQLFDIGITYDSETGTVAIDTVSDNVA